MFVLQIVKIADRCFGKLYYSVGFLSKICSLLCRVRSAQRALRNARDRDVDVPFILFENQKILGAYQLLFYISNEPVLYSILQDDADGRFRIHPVSEGDEGFPSLVELLSFHRSNDAASLKLKNAIRPVDIGRCTCVIQSPRIAVAFVNV